jgi:hypothetical protein
VCIFGSVFAKCFYGSYFIVLMEKWEPSKNKQIKKKKKKNLAGIPVILRCCLGRWQQRRDKFMKFSTGNLKASTYHLYLS